MRSITNDRIEIEIPDIAPTICLLLVSLVMMLLHVVPRTSSDIGVRQQLVNPLCCLRHIILSRVDTYRTIPHGHIGLVYKTSEGMAEY